MKYGSAFRILIICMILGVIGEGCVLLLGIRFHLELRLEQQKATIALKEWNSYNGKTAQLLFSSRSYQELLAEWISSVNTFDNALTALSQSKRVRLMDSTLSDTIDNMNALWSLSHQRTNIIDVSLRDLLSSMENMLPPVGGLLFNLGKLSMNVTESGVNRIFILRTNVRELLSMNEEFYIILSGMIDRLSVKVDRSITDSLVFMALLSIIIILSALQMCISISREITRANIRLEKQISEKNAAEEQLMKAKEAAESADKSKTQFLANVSHELRTPLNSIMGYAELNLIPDEKSSKRDYSPFIIKESEKLLHLVNDILDFSKLEFHKLKLENIPFNLSAMVEESTATLKFRMERKGIEYTISIDPDTPDVLVGDPYRLRQVIVNLLDNAVKFTETGSISLRISPVRVNSESCILQFEVEDTGIGIPLELQQQIFESFTQADGTMSRRYGGTGLGTTIARHLVWLMDGEMALSSIPGKGSSFAFTGKFGVGAGLESVSDGKEQAAAPIESSHGERILLVDDYQPNADVAIQFLSKAGYHVDHAASGRQAIGFVEKNRYDLILMDIQMPDMDGYEATRRIREKHEWVKSIPILALTANAFESDKEKAVSAGMSGLVAKPIRRESFLRAINSRLIMKAPGSERVPVQSGRIDVPASGTREGAGPLQRSSGFGGGSVLVDQFMAEIGDVDTAWELLGGFANTARGQIQLLYDAISRDDLVTLHREAHSIKGGALNIMAPQLAEAARLLECAAKEGDRESILKMIDPVVKEIEAVYGFFQEARGAVQKNAGEGGSVPIE